MKRKTTGLIIAIVALVAVSVAIFSSRTLSYFTDQTDPASLFIGSGDISGNLIETTVPLEGGDPILGPITMRIVPGVKVQKTVAVENTGTGQMYLRLTVDKEFTLSAQNEGQPTDPSLVSFQINSDFWELRDGFYYYKMPIDRGTTTAPLFTEIEFSSKMDNIYENSSITLRIRAYATQVTENGTSVFEAQNWPAVQ